jgi:hypothetical protein
VFGVYGHREKENLKKIINKIANYFGISIKKIKYIDLITDQRNFLLKKFCEKKQRTKIGISCIIFSKDRALQLYALLESMRINCDGIGEIYIIYTCSTADHLNSYISLIDELICTKNIHFIREAVDFKSTLESTINKIYNDKIMFLVDDNLFTKKCNLNNILNSINTYQVISLRLGAGVTYSYTANRKIKQPVLRSYKYKYDFLEFNWMNSEGEWGDPCSLDGNIFSTNIIEVITSTYNFIGPNSYEAGFKTFENLFYQENAICPKQPVIKNLAINKVQNEYKNRFGNISALYLLDKWRSGKKINIEKIKGLENNSTHLEVKLEYIER